MRSRRIQSGRWSSREVASDSVAASSTAKPCLLRSRESAIRAVASSSTTSTSNSERELKTASAGAGICEAHVAAELPREAPADGKPHSETLAAVSLIVVHLVKLVEQKRNVLVRDPDARVGNADGYAVVQADRLENDASLTGVLEGVVQQVADDPLELQPVGLEFEVAVSLDAQGQAFLL